MKKLKYLRLALLVAFLLAIPVAAQDKNEKVERSNNGAVAGINNGAGKLKGKNRAEQVQMENKKGDNDPAKGSKKWKKGKHRGETQGKHWAKGHAK